MSNKSLITFPQKLQLSFFSAVKERWRDWLEFLFKCSILWVCVFIITAFLPELLSKLFSELYTYINIVTVILIIICYIAFDFDNKGHFGLINVIIILGTTIGVIARFNYEDEVVSIFQKAAEFVTCVINRNEFVRLMIQGEGVGSVLIEEIIAYTAGAVISGYFLIEMLRSKRVITIANLISLIPGPTIVGGEREVDGGYLVFRFATGGSGLYNIKAVLDFASMDAWINPTDPREDHTVFEIPENGAYSELIGVHELYFPFDTKSKDGSDTKLGDFYKKPGDFINPEKIPELSATLRIMACTANGTPVYASRHFNIFSKDAKTNPVIEGDFVPTLQNNTRYFTNHSRYHFNHFSEIGPV